MACYNDEIKLARKKRDAFHKAKNWKENWRNETTSLIRSAKKVFFFARSVDENKNCYYLWKHVKNLNTQSNDRSLPQGTVIDDIKSCRLSARWSYLPPPREFCRHTLS